MTNSNPEEGAPGPSHLGTGDGSTSQPKLFPVKACSQCMKGKRIRYQQTAGAPTSMSECAERRLVFRATQALGVGGMIPIPRVLLPSVYEQARSGWPTLALPSSIKPQIWVPIPADSGSMGDPQSAPKNRTVSPQGVTPTFVNPPNSGSSGKPNKTNNLYRKINPANLACN